MDARGADTLRGLRSAPARAASGCGQVRSDFPCPLRPPAAHTSVVDYRSAAAIAMAEHTARHRIACATDWRVAGCNTDGDRPAAVSAGTRAGDGAARLGARDDCGRRRPGKDHPGRRSSSPSLPATRPSAGSSSRRPACANNGRANWPKSSRLRREPQTPSGSRCVCRDLPPDVNPWTLPGLYLSSFDFIKRPEVLEPLEQVHWDIVVIDEAHGASLGYCPPRGGARCRVPREAGRTAHSDAARR